MLPLDQRRDARGGDGHAAHGLRQTQQLQLHVQQVLQVFGQRRGLKQADPQIFSRIDFASIHTYAAVGDAPDQLALYNAADLDVVNHLPGGRQDLPAELDFAAAQRAPPAGVTAPAEEKSDQLP